MTHPLVTDEMVEEVATMTIGENMGWGEAMDRARAALEAVADDIVEAIAVKIDGLTDELGYEPNHKTVARKVRELKSK